MKITSCFSFVMAGLLVLACNNQNDQNKAVEKDPSDVHPPSQAITDSTRLVNDSVIMPDVTPGNGKPVGNSDAIQKNKH